MFYSKITINTINEMLYENENQPILKLSFGRLKNYEFLQKYISPRLLDYKNTTYNTSKIWGNEHSKSSLSKLINRDFVPKSFYTQVYELLNRETDLISEMQMNFKQEWKQLQGDIFRLQETLKHIKEFNTETFGEEWLDYVHSDNLIPEVLLTLLLLYAIINEKAFLLFPCPLKKNNIKANKINFQQSENLEAIGDYRFFYYSAAKHAPEHLIYSRLTMDDMANAKLYNNYDEKTGLCEYTYSGKYIATSHGFILNMKNIISDEFISINLIKSVGNHKRYLGLLLALSASMTPVCVKTACFKENDYKRVNFNILNKVLHSENAAYSENILTYEESAKILFFSDAIFKDYQ